MGTIVDQNSNASANDTWALISENTVINTIISNLSGVETIQANWDYLVDLTVQGQIDAGIGYTYNSGTDTFSSPPDVETNWIEILEEDFDTLASSVQQCLVDSGVTGGNMSKSEIAQAFAAATNDSESTYTTNQAVLMQAIYTYVINGG